MIVLFFLVLWVILAAIAIYLQKMKNKENERLFKEDMKKLLDYPGLKDSKFGRLVDKTIREKIL